ncbi:hypothetical protein SAMN05443247_03091 [Bradyrhizobium erythrophlei]|jgi:hypothetical protein|nr:hypothetical protein SAMN05443247_03091 [Bradyrhizobium erythrophlei]
MIGITLTTDQIRTAPADVRQWIEHQVIASLGLAAETPAAEQRIATDPAAARLMPAGFGCTEERIED